VRIGMSLCVDTGLGATLTPNAVSVAAAPEPEAYSGWAVQRGDDRPHTAAICEELS
jgi:hypothetical protein